MTLFVAWLQANLKKLRPTKSMTEILVRIKFPCC